MAEQSTLARVKRVVIEQMVIDGEAEDRVTEAASIRDDLGADSLDEVTLVMGLEEEFGIEIPDDDADTIKTVADAVQVIDRLRAA